MDPVPPELLQTPWVESPFFEELLEKRARSDEERERARRYREDGFLVLPGFFAPEEVDRVIEEIRPAFAVDPDIRKADLFTKFASVKALACEPRILELLGWLYGRDPIPFQTLNFRVGTQQPLHSDTIHFTSYPGRFMCGVWVALEDVRAEAGPLEYYPGSHRLPEYNLQDLGLEPLWPQYAELYERFIAKLIASTGYQRKTLVVPKGTALIWASNLIHGGSPILEKGSTRWSQVTHYYFKDCFYFQPLRSNVPRGQYLAYNGRDLLRNVHLGHTARLIGTPSEGSGSDKELRSQIQALERMLHWVVHSHSFQIGRILTAPYRRLRYRGREPWRPAVSPAGPR